MCLYVSWLLSVCIRYATSVYLSFMARVPCMWVLVYVCYGCYTPVECMWYMYCTHLGYHMAVVCACSIHFATLFATCILHALSHVSHMHAMCCVWHPCPHTPCVVRNCDVCACMGCTCLCFWLQTAPHRPPGCKWPSRPWMRMTTLPSWRSPTTPLCVNLQRPAR